MTKFNHETTEAVLSVDSEGRILSANHPAEDLLKLSREEMIGKRCYEVIDGRDPSGNLFCFEGCAVIAMAKRNEPARNYDLEITMNGHGKKTVLNVITLLESEANGNGGREIVHIFRPATAQTPDSRRQEIRQSDGLSDLAERFSLPKRETEVLALTVQGLGAKEIGVRLGLTTTTVRTYIQRVLKKLRVRSKLEAIALIFRKKNYKPHS